MKVLEVKPLEKKTLNVLIMEKEYNEPFDIAAPSSSANSNPLSALHRPSIGFYKFLENVVAKVNLDFATEELGIRSQKDFFEDNILAETFRKSNVSFFPVDIDENAKTYLKTAIDKKIEQRECPSSFLLCYFFHSKFFRCVPGGNRQDTCYLQGGRRCASPGKNNTFSRGRSGG